MANKALAIRLRTALLPALLVSAALAAAAGCDGNHNPSPTQTGFTDSTAGTGASGGTGATSPTGGGGAGASSTGGTGGTGGTTTSTINCDGPEGCFNCPPTKDAEFFNACTGAQCSKFDNVARLPLYNGGNLPELP